VTEKSESGESVIKMFRDILFLVRRKGWLCCAFLIIPPADLTPDGHSRICAVCPRDSAGDVRVMWVYQVKISPLPYGLLVQ